MSTALTAPRKQQQAYQPKTLQRTALDLLYPEVQNRDERSEIFWLENEWIFVFLSFCLREILWISSCSSNNLLHYSFPECNVLLDFPAFDHRSLRWNLIIHSLGQCSLLSDNVPSTSLDGGDQKINWIWSLTSRTNLSDLWVSRVKKKKKE